MRSYTTSDEWRTDTYWGWCARSFSFLALFVQFIVVPLFSFLFLWSRFFFFYFWFSFLAYLGINVKFVEIIIHHLSFLGSLYTWFSCSLRVYLLISKLSWWSRKRGEQRRKLLCYRKKNKLRRGHFHFCFSTITRTLLFFTVCFACVFPCWFGLCVT